MSRAPRKPIASAAQMAAVFRMLRSLGVPLWVTIPIVIGVFVVMLAIGVSGGNGQGGGPIDEPWVPEVVTTAPADVGSTTPATGRPLDGFFEEIRNNVFRSPAGLVYRPGSRQGHRLKHVLAHARDQPDRPGPHGVFDVGPPEKVFEIIDAAYEKASRGVDTRTRNEEGRTNHTVDMRRRVGYVGGESGNRQGRPDARRLRLILEGAYVITAYPVR